MKKALVCCFVLVLSPMFLRAQIANNTSLVGTVLDSTGSVVSGAKVTAVEQSTKLQYTATTNETGYYAITFIQGGTYDITVEQTGFGKVTTVVSARRSFERLWSLPWLNVASDFGSRF